MSNPKPIPSGRPDFPKMEEEILDFWDKKNIFERSIEERSENKVFSFYDGPPFATGLPHPGHLLQSTIKDAIPRYWTMNGYRAQRIWGWDCHGLPVENLIEKDLNLKSKKDILDFGIGKFNDACCSSVLTYDKEWRKYIRRIGRWVDMDHSYKTMDDSYIETVWWVFSELYKKDLVYKDFRVSMYCPRCATPLSNHEITMGHSYRDEVDPAITVKLKVVGEENTYLLIWTTTPWTLPANTAVAVHPDLIYIKVQIPDKNEVWILAESRQSEVLQDYLPLKSENGDEDEKPVEILEKVNGSALVGLKYEPLYDFMDLPEGKEGYKVVDMPYVSAEDGTGLVHTAPAFGEEDFQAAKVHNLGLLLTVGEDGKLNDDMGPYAGMPIKDADPLIVKDLEDRGLLVANEKIEHSVPECWRCGTLLMYRAQDAWFVDIQKIKPKLTEANKKISWVPDHIKEGRFGKGLEMAPDWNISRTRFWGAPLPVWLCTECNERKVIGSIKELKELAIKWPENFSMHRPGIDEVEIKCSCGGVMKRTDYVFDCWFESGSMPYASVHYPFENQKDFEAGYPADFIGEAQDQTRGWFYTMHVLAVALFNKPAAKNIVVTGMMLAEDGKKMSKSKKNFTDPYQLMTTIGADALRFYMLSSPIMQAESLNFKDEECSMIQRTIFGTLWNVRQFYLTYSEGMDVQIIKPQSLHTLDRWIFSRLIEVTEHVTANMNNYDIAEALRPIRPFVDDLSTWWLRRSRERIKNKQNPDDAMDALRTLREILLDFAKVLAPFAPFFSEKMYQDLEGGKMSVHLDRWPKPDEGMRDLGLEKDMQWIRDIVNAGLEQRVSTKIPVRQALASIKVAMKDMDSMMRISQKSDLLNLIRDELNVLQVELLPAKDDQADDWKVELDTVLTPELKLMGLHREIVRHVMQLRKQKGMTPQDKIEVTLSLTNEALKEEIKSIIDQIGQDTKADKVDLVESQDLTDGLSLKWEDTEIGVLAQKA